MALVSRTARRLLNVVGKVRVHHTPPSFIIFLLIIFLLIKFSCTLSSADKSIFTQITLYQKFVLSFSRHCFSYVAPDCWAQYYTFTRKYESDGIQTVERTHASFFSGQ